MSKKFQIGFLFLILIAGCSKAEKYQIESDNFPYGKWASKSGYHILIREDETYIICLKNECDIGLIGWKNPNEDGIDDYGPYLLDFDKKPVAMKMMQESLYYNLYQYGSYKHIKHPSFFQHQSKTSKRYCKSRPCKNFGGEDKPEFSFYLIDD